MGGSISVEHHIYLLKPQVQWGCNMYCIVHLQSLAGTNTGNQLLGYSWNHWGSQVVFHSRTGWIVQGIHLRCNRDLLHTHPRPLHSAVLCNLPGDSVNIAYHFTRSGHPIAVVALKVRIKAKWPCSSSSRESQSPPVSPVCQRQEPDSQFAENY